MERMKEVLSRHFKDAGEYDVGDFIYSYGDPKQAILLSRIFCPEFIEVEGNVVLKNGIDANGGPATLTSLLNNGAKPKKEILSGYRWLEVPYLFENWPFNTENDERCLLELIAEAWRGALCYKFPQKKFIVEILEPEVTGSVLSIGFYEESDA